MSGEVVCITEGWADTLLADIVAEALKRYCQKLDVARFEDSVITILYSEDSWYIGIIESTNYTDIYACRDLETLTSYLIEEYEIDEEYDREAYEMLSKLQKKGMSIHY